MRRPRREVRRLADRQLLFAAGVPNRAHHDRPRMDADANRQPDALREPAALRLHGRDDAERGVDHADRIVLVRAWISEVDEDAIAEMLSDVAVVFRHHRADDG
jgi:hypothetical protein